MIEFASGAAIVEFLYGEDIMDNKNYLRHWKFHKYRKHMIEFAFGATLAEFL